MNQNCDVNLIKMLLFLAAILSAVRIWHVIRSHAMRSLAAKLDFQYIGPTAPPKWWWNPPHLEVRPPIPNWVSRLNPSGERIRQIWNVIEGEKNGVTVLIFDAVIGEYKGGHPCTLIACQTEHDPFGEIASTDRVVQKHGWTILHGAWFLWFSWTIRIKRLDDHLSKLHPEY